MWVSIRLPLYFLAVLCLLLLLPAPARAGSSDDPEAQAAEPADGSYYGRRRNPECEAGTSTPDYRLKIAQLRTPDTSLPRPRWVGPYRELRLRAARGDEVETLVPFDAAGEVTSDAAARIADVFCGTRERCNVAIDPRLIRILYVMALHFEAREIVVVSGVRFPEEDGRTSNHHLGRAADVIIPGVPNAEVAAYAREFGHVGVGHYPVSGFVHIDVRDRSFFWEDPSGPGEPICTRAILPDVAREVDELRDPRFEDPRTWTPVPMPPEPVDPEARPERRADRLDEIDDEAAVDAIFAAEIGDDLRRASAEAGAARERRAVQASSNTGSPPTSVATALPGTS